MGDLIDTTEMYLRTIFELREEGVPPLRARIAERLNQTGPTVSETVARMERDGLVKVHPDRHLELSANGLDRAAQVMRRHRLAERLLTDVIGLDWHLVHEEACRWEHVISTDVERRLIDVLEHPTRSPYGNPIPALGELGATAATEAFLDGVEPLSVRLADGARHDCLVVRIGEAAQADPTVLATLGAAGVSPGKSISARAREKFVELGVMPPLVRVPAEVAEHVFVGVPEGIPTTPNSLLTP